MVEQAQSVPEFMQTKGFLQERQHCQAVMRSDAPHFLDRFGIVAAADEQDRAAKPGRCQASDDIDPVGIAQGQIEDDDFRRRLCQGHQQRRRSAERARGKAGRLHDVGNERTDLGLVVQDKSQTATTLRRTGGGRVRIH